MTTHLVNYQESVSCIQRHIGLDARPLDDGRINDQLIKRHLLID